MIWVVNPWSSNTSGPHYLRSFSLFYALLGVFLYSKFLCNVTPANSGGNLYLLKTISLKEKVFVFRSADELDLWEITPRDHEEEGDDEAAEEAQVDVEEDGEEEGRDPNQGLGMRSFGITNEVSKL